MKTVTSCAVETETSQPEEGLLDPVGLTVVAVVPALLWTAIIALIAYAVEFRLSITILALVACTIGAFLTAVYAAIETSAKTPPARSS